MSNCKGEHTLTKAPLPRQEVVPPARHGHVWTPGYWNWTGHRYAWVKGKYVKARAGYHWAAPSWQERDGRWQFTRRAWQRGDRDRDGRAEPLRPRLQNE